MFWGLFKFLIYPINQTANSSNGVFDIPYLRDPSNLKLFKLYKRGTWNVERGTLPKLFKPKKGCPDNQNTLLRF